MAGGPGKDDVVAIIEQDLLASVKAYSINSDKLKQGNNNQANETLTPKNAEDAQNFDSMLLDDKEVAEDEVAA